MIYNTTGTCSYNTYYIQLCHAKSAISVYNHRARGPQAQGHGDYKPEIAQVGMT